MAYITCNHKRTKSKVSVRVCEKCRRKGSCGDYILYRQPLLFPGLEKVRGRRRMTSRAIRPEAKEVREKAEQLKIF